MGEKTREQEEGERQGGMKGQGRNGNREEGEADVGMEVGCLKRKEENEVNKGWKEHRERKIKESHEEMD